MFNPDPESQPRFRPQNPIRMSDMQRMWDRAAAASRDAATGGTCDAGAGMGLQVGDDLLPVGLWARLTTPAVSDSSALYSFSEVQDDGTGSDWTPPHAPLRGDSNAFEINKNTDIVVPGPPTTLTASPAAGGTLNPGDTYYYVVTATWTDADGNALQSDISNDVFVVPGGGNNSALLLWVAPAAAEGFTLTGYQIWRGTSPGVFPGNWGVLVTTISNPATLTYTDTGSTGTSESPILGGTAGPVVWMSPLATNGYYKFTWQKQGTEEQFIKPTTTTPSTIILPGGRQVTDGVLNGTTTLTSSTANFTTDDVGKTLVATGIPVGTTIASRTNNTTVVMSAAATTSATGVTVTIGGIVGFAAKLDPWSNNTGAWSDSADVWFFGANNETPTSGTRYLCKQLGVDEDGKAVWAQQIAPGGGVNLQTGTSYTYQQSDNRKLVSRSNASSMSDTLPVASSFGASWFVDIENRGTGTLFITPTTSTIDGAAGYGLTANQGVRIYSNGSNYFTFRGMASGGINQQTGTSYTFSLFDYARLVSFSNASPITATLGTPSFYGPSWFVEVENRGAGTLTINSSAPLGIDGASSFTVPANQGVKLYTDGANWFTWRGITAVVPVSLPNGTVVLSTDVFITASLTTALSTTVPSTGTYLFTAQLNALGSYTGATWSDLTSAIALFQFAGPVTAAESVVLQPRDSTGNAWLQGITLQTIRACTAGDFVNVQVGMRNGSMTGWGTPKLFSTASGGDLACRLSFIKLGT